MNSKISELLDLYVRLSGENYNISDMLHDAERCDKLIPEITRKIEKLEDSMSDDKYFDASSEIIDRNIEVSLERKIDYLKNRLKKLHEKDAELTQNKKVDEERFSSLNKALSSCQSFIYDLSKFDYEISSTNILKLIEMENERYDIISNEIENKQNGKDDIEQTSLSIREQIFELERKIQNEQDRLKDVKEALLSKKSYIDEQAKSDDLQELEELKDELEDVKTRKINILNSVTYQTDLVKKELVKDTVDKEKIMSILSNIASRLNDLPYLGIDDETILDEEYNQLCSQRDELSAVIENKRYNLKNKKPYEIRYDYLNQKLNNAKDIMEDYNSLLKFIINQEIEVTIDNLLRLKDEQKELDNAFSSSDKAAQQKKYVAELITSYENDLTNTLGKARDIKEKIQVQKSEIDDITEEIKNLSTEKKLHFDLENQAEKEYDNKLLEDIIEKLDYINNRQEVGTTPNQILDQVEMLLYENEQTDEQAIDQDIYNDSIIKNYQANNDYTFEKVDGNEEDSFNQDEMIVSPDKYINEENEETKEFSFSPIDNTGFVSFADAYDIAK